VSSKERHAWLGSAATEAAEDIAIARYVQSLAGEAREAVVAVPGAAVDASMDEPSPLGIVALDAMRRIAGAERN
jgi:hypothetical protein